MLNAKTIQGFVEKVLLPYYDDPVEVPAFHYDLWDRCTSKDRYVALACPRGFAKSTAITVAYTLASVLFRERRYVVIISDTEDQAIEFLGALKTQLKDNERLNALFPVSGFTKDGATDVIVEMVDGYKFRMIAKGAGQKIRGRLWNNTRPDLIIGDDMENDEMVESSDRRNKLHGWVLRAVLPALSRNGVFRVVGTILHLDSILMRLIKSKSFNSIVYKAHRSFDNFSDLLWPEFWSEEKLRAIRQQYLDSNSPEGYSQEYLNNPADQHEAFFKATDLLPMSKEDLESRKNYFVGVDFAISDSDTADYTVLVVGGVDSGGILNIVEVLRGRWDSLQIVDNIFDVQTKYNPELFTFESGAIEKAIGPLLEREEADRGIYISKTTKTPLKDKRTRARPIQGRMRAGKVRVNKEADWFADFAEEILSFPKGVKKDQVDALAYIGLTLNELSSADTDAEVEAEQYSIQMRMHMRPMGRDMHTGY